jgi:bifunctional enzyme CysN/CysC
VQYVIRPQSGTHLDYRGYAGTLAGGVFKPGDEVVILPSGFTSSIVSIDGPGGVPVNEAYAPMAVTIRLADELDISRGDMIARVGNRPTVGQDIDATICWMDERSALQPGGRYTIKHTTRSVRTVVQELNYRLDINTLHRDESAEALDLNDIGRVRLRTQAPLLYDEYRRNRATGSFILVDDGTNATVAAGMILATAS